MWLYARKVFSGLIICNCICPLPQTSVTFRGPRKTALIKQFIKDTFWGKLDYLIFDTPPGTSDEHLTILKILQQASPDGAIIVTTPQEVRPSAMICLH